MKGITVGLLCVCLVLGLSSCVHSKNPLGDKADAILDPRLLGIWYKQDADTPDYEQYLGVSENDDKTYSIFYFATNEPPVDEQFRGYISKIGNDHYASLQFFSDGKLDNDGEYSLMYYNIKPNGELVISQFDDDFFEKAVKNGKLKGIKPPEADGKGLKVLGDGGKLDFGFKSLADTTENIVKFIKRNKKERFLDKDETYTYKLLRKWATRPADAETNKE